MNKKNIYTLLFITFISLIFFGIIYLSAFTKKTDNYSKLSIVKDYNIYFSIVENVNYYIDTLKEKDNTKLYSLLDNNYIKKFRINKNNILKKFDDIDKEAVFSGEKIYYLNNDNKYLFLVNGRLVNNETQDVINNNYKVVMLIDYNKLLISFYPLEKEKDIDYINSLKIEINQYNKLKTSKALTDKNMCKLYYETFIKYVNSDINSLYNISIDDIKSKYLIEEFVSKVNNKYKNYKYNFYSCDVDYNKDNGNRVFNLIDNKNNNIYFYEEGVMNFKVKMDLD